MSLRLGRCRSLTSRVDIRRTRPHSSLWHTNLFIPSSATRHNRTSRELADVLSVHLATKIRQFEVRKRSPYNDRCTTTGDDSDREQDERRANRQSSHGCTNSATRPIHIEGVRKSGMSALKPTKGLRIEEVVLISTTFINFQTSLHDKAGRLTLNVRHSSRSTRERIWCEHSYEGRAQVDDKRSW